MIASETTRNASIAVIVAVAAMLLYIAFAFRKMPNPFKFGVCAVIGLALDLLIALGVFSILGAIRGWQIDLMFIAGILAMLGYSINNTVIVFDRIRENMARGISSDIEVVANNSIVETLGRSFNTTLTTLFTLFVSGVIRGSFDSELCDSSHNRDHFRDLNLNIYFSGTAGSLAEESSGGASHAGLTWQRLKLKVKNVVNQ